MTSAANTGGDGGHSILLAFDTDHPEFIRGYEIGRTFTILGLSDEPFDCELHSTNAEMILRVAEARGRTVRIEELGNEWVTAYFGEAS